MENSGFLLIHKPAGMTSHDVVDAVRRITGERRVGHAGTLDPFATGLLIVGVGRAATSRLSEFVGLDKVYEATFVLGATSTTDDPEGEITPANNPPLLSPEGLGVVMQSFLGDIEQIPPQYAAIKIKGKKMYELAREGKTIEAKPRQVHIESFELLSPLPSTYQFPLSIQVRIHCGSGTYIRAIARDLGEKLGVGGYVSELRRTAIGRLSVQDASLIEALERGDWHKSLRNLGVEE
ncbi:MAG: tRNA pseudouridine(55) synthase TruB [Patescibacteria group bacterium]